MKIKLSTFKNIFLSLIILSLVFFISLIFIIIPAIMLNRIISKNTLLFPTLFKQLLIFFIFLSLPFLIKKSKLSTILLSFIAGLYFSIVYFFIACWYLTRNIFNPYYLIDSYYAIIPTGTLIFGKFIMFMLFFSLIALLVMFYFLFKTFFKFTDQYRERLQFKGLNYKYLLIVPFFILPLIPPYQGYITSNYNIINKSQKARKFFQPIMPNHTPNLKKSNDNIFILQLESVNALTLQGQLEINNTKYPEIYIPNLHQIAKDGIFFPYFWSNSIQTDRAQENILCSIAGNIGPSFAHRSENNLQSCLPNVLKAADYKTIAFRSDKLSFNNMGVFLNNLGFEEIHYEDIMQPEDIKYKWGYDDCIFYQRAFEYLKRKYLNPQKLMVYFEVSSTHIPWENKEQYDFADKISKPETYAEKYINAQAEQDFCLAKFYEEFRNYNPPQTNLIVLSDTSAPLGINNNDIFNFQNNYNESFITFLLYIPPHEKAQNFQVGKIVSDPLYYSHNDILPTIYELLSETNFQNSFAYELFKKPTAKNHEDCQLLSQPYSGSYIMVINKDDKYTYSIIDKTVTHSNIKTDLWEKNTAIIENKATFEEFKQNYFCPRYK